VVRFRQGQTDSGATQPLIQWIPGTLSPGVKRMGHEANHPPKPSAEVKTRLNYTSITHTSSWSGACLSTSIRLDGVVIT
jgi:hypothetical protein